MKNTIRVERARKRISQQDLANETNLTRSIISQIETGKVDPKLSTARKIAKYFNLKISELFSL